MPSKFSYSELAQTHDRLKREAQPYLDSLDVSSSDVTSTISRDEVQETKSNVDAAGDHDHSGVTQTSDFLKWLFSVTPLWMMTIRW